MKLVPLKPILFIGLSSVTLQPSPSLCWELEFSVSNKSHSSLVKSHFALITIHFLRAGLPLAEGFCNTGDRENSDRFQSALEVDPLLCPFFTTDPWRKGPKRSS